MTRMFQSLDLFVLGCLFLAVQSQEGQILPPKKLSLQWMDDFKPELSWEPPPHSVENCTYTVFSNTNETYSETTDEEKTPYWSKIRVMFGGFLNFSVVTLCNGVHSKPATFNVTYPDLVKNLKCSIFSSKNTSCSWVPVSHVPELGFYYRLVNEDGTQSATDLHLQPLKACPSYTYTNGVRTGCELTANVTQDVAIVFNATMNNFLVRNTFKEKLNVKPYALQWKINITGNKFNIEWNPPDISDLSDWNFIINYTECNDIKFHTAKGTVSTELQRKSHCHYHMAIQAKLVESKGEGETPWSEEMSFNADPSVLVYAFVIIPLIIAGLAVLTFVYCRKNKDTIFPRIPKPRDFLSDISDNNNKSNVRNLYIPAEEEDNCKITLVIDPQNNNVSS